MTSEPRVASAPAAARITPADRTRSDTARAVVPPPIAPPVSAPPIRASTSSNPTVVVPPSVPPATATGTTAPSERAAAADIERLVADYARAIESRDMAAVRRANGGLSDAQQRGFAEFFDAVRGLRVTFALSALDVSGATAEGRLTGAYDYTATSGKAEHQPVSFRATFAREGGSWRITAVR
jgi:serine/threonine-protein kinase